MRLIPAEEARQLAQNSLSYDIFPIMTEIEKAAKEGKTELHLYEPLAPECLCKLQQLGYELPPVHSVDTQKGGLYHTISWRYDS